MKTIVTTPFLGVPDGQVHPIEFAPGDEVHGELAAEAVAAGWAAPENKGVPKAPRNKAKE